MNPHNLAYDLFPHPTYCELPMPLPMPATNSMLEMEKHLVSALHRRILEAAIAEGKVTFTPKARYIYGHICPAFAECVVSHAIAVCEAPGLQTKVIAYAAVHLHEGRSQVSLISISRPLLPHWLDSTLQHMVEKFLAARSAMEVAVEALLHQAELVRAKKAAPGEGGAS